MGSDVALVYLTHPIKNVPFVKVSFSPLSEMDIGSTFVAVGYGMQNQKQSLHGRRMSAEIQLKTLTGRPMEARFGSLDAFLKGAASLSGRTTPWTDEEKADLSAVYNSVLLDDYEAYFDSEGGANICHGDSGGPLLKTINGELTSFGVASWVFPVQDSPCALGEVYARFGPVAKEFLSLAMVDGCANGNRCAGNMATQCDTSNGKRAEKQVDCSATNDTCRVANGVASCFPAR